MIRHAGLGLALAVGTLAVPMTASAGFGLLITAVGPPPPLAPGLLAAGLATIALPTVASAAHVE